MSAFASTDPRVFVMSSHGPSPYGLSYWSTWRECGRKASLKAAEQAKGLPIVDDDAEPETVANVENYKLQMLWVGLYVHAMQEFITERGILATDVVWPEHLAGDINFREAVRLFLGYHARWGSIEERWGCRILGVEVPLGEKDLETVARILGGPFTGRADAIIEVVDSSKALRNTGLALIPGRYVLDYKCSKAKNKKDEVKFSSRNLQSCGYLWLDALEQGEGGAIGTIFDRIYAYKKLDAEAYGAYVAYPQLDTEERLRAVIAVGQRNMREPLPDSSACENFFGEVCFFKRSGVCAGY